MQFIVEDNFLLYQYFFRVLIVIYFNQLHICLMITDHGWAEGGIVRYSNWSLFITGVGGESGEGNMWSHDTWTALKLARLIYMQYFVMAYRVSPKNV